MPKTEHVLTVAIFGHGCENLLDPFPIHDPVGDFYKNRVRVFSQACVPDIPSVTAASSHKYIAKSIRDHMQSARKDSDTLSILEQYISECKQTYVEIFKKKSTKTTHSEFDERLFDPHYNARSCGTMAYLANKTFHFYETSPAERSTNLHGIVLLDVRLKKTFEDGHVEYERVFTAPRNNDPIILTTSVGLLYLLRNVLGQKKTEYDTYLKFMGFIGKKTNLTEIDLIKLSGILKIFDFVNILDYTCRECVINTAAILSRRKLSPRKIEEIYAREQLHSSLLPNFGGKRSRTMRKSKKPGKTRKMRKN